MENNTELLETSEKISPDDINRLEGEAISAEKEINQKVNDAINSVTAPRRWFWELLQNAIDTVGDNEKVIVQLDIKNTEQGIVLQFSHTGGPFRESRKKYRFDDFKNLINPTSGKSEEDTSTVGKFGTGFLSTHILSLKVDVEGIFEISAEDKFKVHTCLDRKDFLLTTDEARNKRIESIINSLVKYEESKKAKPKISTNTPVASFTYYLNESKFNDVETVEKIINEGLGEIKHSLPFVMTFTSKIKEVVINDLRQTVSKGSISYTDIKLPTNSSNPENGLFTKEIEIKRNGIPEKISIVYLKNNDCTIAWHAISNIDKKLFIDCRGNYEKELNHEMSSLFSTFPLIGSQDFKFPVILHSDKFKPNTERDGINLKVNDDQNRKIVESAIGLYKSFLEYAANEYKNIYYICDIKKEIKNDHKWIDRIWFAKYQNDLKEIILKEKIIDTTNSIADRKSIIGEDSKPQIFFPDLRITNQNLDEENKNRLMKQFYNFSNKLFSGMIPNDSVLYEWKDILWLDKEKIQLIDEKDLIIKISDQQDVMGLAKFFGRENFANYNLEEELLWLSNFYSALWESHNDIKLFDYSIPQNGSIKKFPIIPSRSLKFAILNELFHDNNLEERIIQEDLLNIYNTFLPEQEMYDKLIYEYYRQWFKQHLTPVKTEKSIVEELIVKIEEELKKHESLLETIEKDQTNEDVLSQKKEIEKKLSLVYNWISKYNGDKNYFKEHLKRKILQAIIDEKESMNLTTLLELHRNGLTLEKQTQILKDPDLPDKLKEGEKALKAIADNDKEFENRKAKGKYFENFLKQLLYKRFGEDNVNHIDGTQDFILFNKFYIELKTTQGGSEVMVSPDQAKESKQQGKNYYLAIFYYTHENYTNVLENEFEKGLVFTNQLGDLVESHVNNLDEIKRIDFKKVHIVYPEFYLSFKGMKPYRYVVKNDLWGDLKFNDWVKEIESKREVNISSN